MEIEIEKTETKKETVTVNVGDCFQRDGLFYFKVVKGGFAIKVVLSEFQNNVSIETCSVQHIFKGNATTISSILFTQVFNQVSEILRNLVEPNSATVEIHEPVKTEVVKY
jgi:hypothetical protein